VSLAHSSQLTTQEHGKKTAKIAWLDEQVEELELMNTSIVMIPERQHGPSMVGTRPSGSVHGCCILVRCQLSTPRKIQTQKHSIAKVECWDWQNGNAIKEKAEF